MTIATAVPRLMKSPGVLYWAPLGTTEPASVAAAGKYTDADWTVTWVPLGATDAGTKFHYAPKFEAVDVAEYLDPIEWDVTGREGNIAFGLADFTAANLSKALNGAVTTVTGSALTLSTKIEPPAVGAEVRCMIGWQSLDGTARIVVRRCVNAAALDMDFVKLPAKTIIPMQFNFEMPLDGTAPFAIYRAG